MEDLNDLGGPYPSRVGFTAMDPGGNHAGFSNARVGTYIFMTGDLREPVKLGNLIRITDGLTHTTVYTYDAVSRAGGRAGRGGERDRLRLRWAGQAHCRGASR